MNLSRALLADVPRRWRHVQGVSARGHLFRDTCSSYHFELLIGAGLAHDIGYAPSVADTGFHPIDGARYLRKLGFHEDLVCLVAHHTCAAIEADLRDMGAILREEFPRRDSLPHDELLYCDLTTGPNGECVTVEGRLAEVKQRYGCSSIVHRFIIEAEAELLAASRRAEAKVAQSPSVGTPRDVFTRNWTSPDVPSGGCSVLSHAR